MGVLDYFSKDAAKARRRERALKKLTNMYYQQADRMMAADSVFELAEEGDAESVRVLLARFEHLCPSSTVDQEEKHYVVGLLVGLGDRGVETITEYCRKTRKPIFWPLKALEKMWPSDMLEEFLAELLEATSNDYCREPEKKIGLVEMAAQFHGERVVKALLPFAEDHHEQVRYTVIDTLLHRDFDSRETLLPRLAGEEDSVRMLSLLAEGFASKGWSVAESVEQVKANLPAGFVIQGGKVAARA